MDCAFFGELFFSATVAGRPSGTHCAARARANFVDSEGVAYPIPLVWAQRGLFRYMNSAHTFTAPTFCIWPVICAIWRKRIMPLRWFDAEAQKLEEFCHFIWVHTFSQSSVINLNCDNCNKKYYPEDKINYNVCIQRAAQLMFFVEISRIAGCVVEWNKNI